MWKLRKADKDVYIKWIRKRKGKAGMGRKILKGDKAVNMVKEHFHTYMEFP